VIRHSVVATLFFVAYEPILEFLGMEPLRYAVPLQLGMAPVLVYGIAYFYVYRDLVENRNCAKLGVYGKTAVFVLLAYYWPVGEIVFDLVIPGIVDLIFAGLDLEFLVRFGAVPATPVS
jgi:hypothetical protein